MNTDTEQFKGAKPGPYNVGDAKGYNASNVYGPGDSGICQLYGVPMHTPVEDVTEPRWQEGMATGRLLAASPDLLRERNELRAALEKFCNAATQAEDGLVRAGHHSSAAMQSHLASEARSVLARCGK
jgi:hypothetical protein